MTIALLSFASFVTAALALWVASRVARRPVPGTGPFVWLSAAIALWCVTSGFIALADTVPDKLVWAKVQYAGIAAAAPLWLLFLADYARLAALARPARRLALWIVPAITVAAAVTNGWHQAMWTSVTLTPQGLAIWAHGWWFWVAAAYNYALLAAGTVVLARVLRRSPPPFAGQLLALVMAAAFPWVGNALYLAGALEPGFDVTPLTFTGSILLLAWALYRSNLFDLVPVARDVVVDSLDEAAIVLDAERRVLDMNAAAREMLAHMPPRTDSNWLGQPVEGVFPFLTSTPVAPTDERPSGMVLIARPEPRYFDVRVMPVRTGRRGLDASVVLLRDVTDQREAAMEREALEQRIQEQQRRESLSVLAGGLAHDFNNLLAGIVGNADLLALQVPPSSEMGGHVGAILLGAQRAADLVSKMLAYAGERHGTTARVDLDALTRDLLDLLRASAARHCTLNYDGAAAPIDADPIQVRQVAMNLIINAAEAVDEEKGIVTVTTGVETLAARQLAEMRFGQDAPPGRYAFIEVRDNGNGMDEDTIRRIFNPFYTTKPSGHGLGLAAVQGIVIGHRGALRVDSSPGWGSRFCVWFPMAVTPERADPPIAHPAGAVTPL
jgi:signal transduction histidine kinase